MSIVALNGGEFDVPFPAQAAGEGIYISAEGVKALNQRGVETVEHEEVEQWN